MERTELQNNQLPPAVLDVKQAANYLNLSKSTLDKKRSDGSGPRFVKLGRRAVYTLKDLNAWLQKQPTFISTAEAGESHNDQSQ